MIQPAALGGGLALFEDLPAPLHLDLVDGMTYQLTRDPRVSPAGDHETLASAAIWGHSRRLACAITSSSSE
jgi:hypothetical protein